MFITVTRLVLAAAVALPMSGALDRMRQSPRDELIVSIDWLKQHINDRDLVLLHVGEKPGYDAEHIPGARFIKLEDIAAPPPADHMAPDAEVLELPDAAVLRAKLESYGISDKSKIVVYYGKDWLSPSTRIIFTLDWIGLGDRTALLDGGMVRWKNAGGPVTKELPTITTGKLSVKPTKSLVVDAKWVSANATKPGIALIDARSKSHYDGVSAGMKKAGHIAGAGNLPHDQVSNDSLRLEPEAKLRALLTSAGVKPGDTVVGYCHIGQYATAVLFAARTLGHKVLLYDGSFHDWEKRDLPVVK